MTPTWTILIASISSRAEMLENLLTENLLPQVERADGAVTVECLWNNAHHTLCSYRNLLVRDATAKYTCFVDDDDVLPPYYVERVLPLLADDVDYIGWRMQCFIQNVQLAPTFHSLRYESWYEDAAGHYRDISHLNPMRREIAVQGNFCKGGWPEDLNWSKQLRGLLRTEHFIDDIMYFYYDVPAHSVAGAQGTPPIEPGTYARPEIDHPYFSWHQLSDS